VPLKRFRWVNASALKALLAGVIVIVLVHQIGVTEIWASLQGVRGWYLPLAVVILVGESLIRSLNWLRLLRTRSPEVRFGPVFHGYLYGGVLGGFLPSTLGSDAARTAIMARRTPLRVAELASSIIVLNALGLWTLCAIALVQSLRFLGAGSTIPLLPWTVAVSAFGLGGLTLMFIAAPCTHGTTLNGPRPVRFVLGILRTLAEFARDRRALVTVALTASGAFLAQFLVVFLLATALGLALSFNQIALLLPIVLLSRLVPLSIGGFGAEQGVFVFAFSTVGIADADAFALSLATSAVRLVFWAMCGLIIFVTSTVAALYILPFRSLPRRLGRDL
jgi:glycosyltransferase 2 family protein